MNKSEWSESKHWNLEVYKGVKIKKLVSLLNLRRKSAQICFFDEGIGAVTFEIVVFCFVWSNQLKDVSPIPFCCYPKCAKIIQDNKRFL